MSELTSKLTIRDLPNEVMIKVLGYLDQHNLKNATLACKHWCNLIESSCKWSIRLHDWVRLDDSVRDMLDFMLTTNRKFGTIEYYHSKLFDENKILEIFQRHGVSVVKLRYHNKNLILFAGLLKFMPNLKHVYMRYITRDASVSDSVPPEQDLPELKKLKILEIMSCDSSTVNCFQKAKLTTINVADPYFGPPLNDELLVDFLKSQKMLTSLTFKMTSNLFHSEKWSTPMPFQLTHLSLLDLKLFDYKVLVKFLKPQANTLKELEIGCFLPSFVYEFVLASMTKLNTLTIRMNDLPRDMAFYERLEENRSITKLILGDSAHINEFPNFLKKLPNVHTVIARQSLLHQFPNKTLRVISQGLESLNKLKSLATNDFNGRSFNGVRLPNLKILEIRVLSGQVDWKKFTRAHAQLTELTIETIRDKSYLHSFDINQIMSNVSLQSLRLGVGFTADKGFFNNIRNKCPDLKVLDLDKSCMPDTLKDNIDCKVLRLCDTIRCSLMD